MCSAAFLHVSLYRPVVCTRPVSERYQTGIRVVPDWYKSGTRPVSERNQTNIRALWSVADEYQSGIRPDQSSEDRT